MPYQDGFSKVVLLDEIEHIFGEMGVCMFWCVRGIAVISEVLSVHPSKFQPETYSR